MGNFYTTAENEKEERDKLVKNALVSDELMQKQKGKLVRYRDKIFDQQMDRLCSFIFNSCKNHFGVEMTFTEDTNGFESIKNVNNWIISHSKSAKKIMDINERICSNA